VDYDRYSAIKQSINQSLIHDFHSGLSNRHYC